MMFTVTPERGLTVLNHPTDATFYWHGDDDELVEFRYIVTQTEDEGPERMEYRIIGKKGFDGIFRIGDGVELPGTLPEWQDWADLPVDQGDPPKEVIEHFLG